MKIVTYCILKTKIQVYVNFLVIAQLQNPLINDLGVWRQWGHVVWILNFWWKLDFYLFFYHGSFDTWTSRLEFALRDLDLNLI